MAIANEAVVNIHEAKTHFSKLIERVLGGERIVIAKAGKPVAVLGPYAPQGKRPLGKDNGKVFIHDDWDDPLPEFEEYM
jgi:prevent-host-death family protein